MRFIQRGLIRYLTFDSLADLGIKHAMITRQGGVSPAPWNSLNVGGTVGDEHERVLENRRRVFDALGRDFHSMYDVWQVHGNNVICTDAPRDLSTAHLKADAILTDQPAVTLFMRFADCTPIMLYDPIKRVVGLVHAGWQGTVKKTAAFAIQAMQDRYGVSATDVFAVIGPSIGAHHYEVGNEVAEQVRQAFAADASALLTENGSGDRVQFDLWRANQIVLEQAGVRNVEVAGICTACNLQDWYSHRAEHGRTGRFGALICL